MSESDSAEMPFNISPEFIEENKKINLVKPRQKFAPYTKAERTKRRQEVYRLHFEQGISSIKIAERMNVDRNTINNDIQLAYKELYKESEHVEFDYFYAKQVARLESQRTRLLSYLDNTSEVEKKLAIERQITDIDFKLISIATKLYYGGLNFWDAVYKKYNDVAEKKNLDYRLTTIFEAIKIPPKARKRLDELLKERMG